MTKKIILILGIVIILVIVALFMLGGTDTPLGEGRLGFSVRDYFPFGTDDSATTTPTDGGTSGDDDDRDVVTSGPILIPKLRKISNEPVAGAVTFLQGTTTVVRFVEKGTGNVYEAYSNSNTLRRLTNTTIPKIIRAQWFKDGSGFVAQTIVPELEIAETRIVKLIPYPTGANKENLTDFNTNISNLPSGIREFAISTDNKKILYYVLGAGSIWYSANSDGSNITSIISHPLSEWLIKSFTGTGAIVQQKSSAEAISYNYFLNIAKKSLSAVGVGGAGLGTVVNNDASQALISQGGAEPILYHNDLRTGTPRLLSTRTLAEKCTWAEKSKTIAYCAVPKSLPDGVYPDSWYKGSVSTDDIVQTIDVIDNVYYNPIDLSDLSKERTDVVDIATSPDDSHLIFRNKIDGYLWLLRLE